MSPEKRVDRAIAIACQSGVPHKIAAKIYPDEREYFNETLAPLIRASAAVRAVAAIGALSRQACRRDIEQRFDVSRMARAYEDVYRRIVTG
jgi:hypothetical protein